MICIRLDPCVNDRHFIGHQEFFVEITNFFLWIPVPFLGDYMFPESIIGSEVILQRSSRCLAPKEEQDLTLIKIFF